MGSGVKALVCVLLCLTRSLYVSVTVHQMIKMEMMGVSESKDSLRVMVGHGDRLGLSFSVLDFEQIQGFCLTS